MTVVTKIQKWGNSQGLRLSEELLADADIDVGDPFHLSIPEGLEVTGFVMIQQVKSIDFRARKAKRIGTAPEPVLDEALSLLDACLY